MTRGLINSVAEATTHRDRDQFTHAIAALIQQHLSARRLRWYAANADGSASCCIRLGDDAGADAQANASSLPHILASGTSRTMVGSETVTVFPIEGDGCVVGALEIRTAHALTDRDEGLVMGLLRILKNHVGLLDYGERDTLTGLLNRKPFEGAFDKVRQHCGVRPDHAGWLGVIDIDHFKSINDRFGHLFGDEVLLLVARLMQETFRGADKLFRFGGEEFVILLEEATVEGAQLAFERIRDRIQDHRFPQVGAVTISLGYTRISPKEASSACLERADAALYYGKQQGRNCVHGHEGLMQAGKLTSKQQTHEIELF